MNHQDYCDALEGEVDRFAAAYELSSSDLPVPTCPGWSVYDVAEHLGIVHRWAERLVSLRSPTRIPSDEMDLDRGPVDAPWMRRGGEALVSTLRAGDPETPMWAWGEDQHLRFWPRRQLHETLMHRMDVEIASGISPYADSSLAADCLDEFLANLLPASRFSPLVRELKGHGEVLLIRANDTDATWSMRLLEDGFEMGTASGPSDAVMTGTALELLLAFYRRQPLASTSIACDGSAELIEFWLGRTALD
ncbi:MAG: maleylpyruvate isomerase family mycothiol-dependent enzyme [Acidimicrobiales bacterium]